MRAVEHASDTKPGFTADSPKIRYWTAGERGPTVLLIMGFGMRGDMWRPQIELLRDAHRVAWFDHRGVGESERGDALFYETADLADDAVRVLDALGWEAAHVVGVSMGGMVAQEVVLRAPARALSLTLLATLGGGSLLDKLPPRKGLEHFLRANVSDGDARLEAAQQLLYPDEFLATVDRQALRARMEQQLLRPVPRSTLLGQLSAVLRHDTTERLSRVSVPTLIVQPERDVLIRPAHSDVLHRHLPHARKVTLPAAGHGLIFQSAREVTTALETHIAEAERGRPGRLAHDAPWPAVGTYAEGFRPVAEQFAAHLANGDEIGAGLTVYHRGELVVDLVGGLADVATRRPWRHDTRLVMFSVTKGLAAIALNLLSDRGQLDWDAPVARYWPGFAANGKGGITVRALFQHQAGLAGLDARLTLEDCLRDWPKVVRALEAQRPDSPAEQGYHAITYGMYARALFERIAGESMGTFLRQEWLEPLGSDARLGAGPEWDAATATLYAPDHASRVGNMLVAGVFHPDTREGRVARALIKNDSMGRRAFGTPAVGRRGALVYNDEAVRRAELPWGSATASARGIARAFLPLSTGGTSEGRKYLAADTVRALTERTGWSPRDAVLQKPIGWNRGFLKEEEGLFGPNREAFGHAGMGGALGWADPKSQLAIGYLMNKMDWRVRSPRALALCRALYACAPVREG
jgi:CubicO group peptidase (beta-lactamase class C family)/pimeloyl-ACP methyl ester carboxylesterase